MAENERVVELAGDADSHTIKFKQMNPINGEEYDMHITVYGNGEMLFTFPDATDSDKPRNVVKQASAYWTWLNSPLY